MATFDAAIARSVSIELKEKIFGIYTSVLPLVTAVSTWELNALDPALPEPFAVKVQLDAYQALALERLRLSDWVTALQKAYAGDTLTYPPPPIVGGLLTFDELSFETISF